MLAFLGAGEARREGRRRGWRCCRWRPGRRGDGLPVVACWAACLAASGCLPAGGWAAVICGGNSAVFNQLLTIFLVVAMVWRLPVFFLCSYCLFWRLLGRFRLPGAGAAVGGPVVVLGELSTGTIKGGGSGKRAGVFLGWGRFIPPHPPHPSTDFGVAENRPGVFLQSGPEII